MAKRKKLHDHPELLGMPEVRKLWQTECLFSDHYLRARLRKNDWWPGDADAQPVFQFCRELYEKRAFALRRYDNEMGVRQEFIDKVLERIGFAWSDNLRLPETKQDLEPDYILYPDCETKESVLDKSVAERYRAGVGILEAKKFGHPLSQISKHQQRYPHQQIRDYLQESDSIIWGILTNGEVWRLYCRDSKASHYFALNFEIALKSLEDFKVFLALFSSAAFARDNQGKCRLDQVRENALATQSELEADLRERIFTIVEILANGFAERPENKITDADLPRLYENCLIFLYRLLFILYAEGRLLLPVEPKSRKYYKQLSLARLLVPLKSFTEYDSQTQTRFYRDIHALCLVINGTDKKANDEFGVPRYNGGLFDPDRYPLLKEWVVADAVLADVLRQLMFTPEKGGQKFVPFESVDYADLSVQQLGSIYEGLLEHHFVREGGKLVLKTDKAERKATGTYYTPDYIVKYIVEQTLAPLLQEIEQREPVKAARAAGKQDNSFAVEGLKLNICDPAMGSGHFLVEATTFLADQIVYHPTTKFQAEFVKGESQEETEIAYWRRRVVEACIYGVDLNPLAVELAKLSLWLTTISTDQPLNFLDHHLRCGNSLIGARLDQLGSLPQKKGKRDERQIRFVFGPDFRRVVAETIGQIHEIEGEASRDMATVKAKEKRWEVEILPRLGSYKKVANLWTNVFFNGPLSEEEYLAAAKEILVETQKGADRLQEAAARYGIKELGKPYFHWELEFPEVFFNDDGAPKTAPGFDVVVGNPPWGAELSTEEKEFYRVYDTDTSTPNSYIYFVRRAELMTRTGGMVGVVLPDSILVKDYAKTRRTLLRDNTLTHIVYLDRAFKGVNHDTSMIIFRRGKSTGFDLAVGVLPRNVTTISSYLVPIRSEVFDNHELEYRFNLNLVHPHNQNLYLKLATLPKFGEMGEFHEGIHTGNIRDKLFHKQKPQYQPASRVKPCLIGATYGDEFGRYFCAPNGNWTIYDRSLIRKDKKEYASLRDEGIFIGPKLYVTRTGDDFFSFFDESHYASNNLFSFKFKAKESALSYWFVMTLLNSAFAQRFNRLFLAPRFGDLFTETKILHLELLPFPKIQFMTPEKSRVSLLAKAKQLYQRSLSDGNPDGLLAFVKEQLVAKPERADVVHDLLAFLAKQMTALNQEKRAAVKQFLTDLKDFHGVDPHGLKPKTKLDTFWELEAAEVFAHFRVNKLRLKESDEEKIRARFQNTKEKLFPLEAQIASTDGLIDRIVYRLYGLAEDEIELVEENLKK